MPLPETFPELAIAGYVHKGNGHCTACRAPLEWFATPKGNTMPFSKKKQIVVGQFSMFEQTAETKYEPHFANCPAAERFRRRKRA
jgi:hypothetical protein